MSANGSSDSETSPDLQQMLSKLPDELLPIFETTRKSDLRLSTENDTSFLNRYKLVIESNNEFDWWPLRKPTPNVKPGESRLHWTVSIISSIGHSDANGPQLMGEPMCNVVTAEEAELITQILAVMSEHPPRCYCCMPKPDRMTWTTVWQNKFRGGLP